MQAPMPRLVCLIGRHHRQFPQQRFGLCFFGLRFIAYLLLFL